MVIVGESAIGLGSLDLVARIERLSPGLLRPDVYELRGDGGRLAAGIDSNTF